MNGSGDKRRAMDGMAQDLSTQTAPVKLEEWANRTLMNFSKSKCKSLAPGRNSPVQQYRLGG